MLKCEVYTREFIAKERKKELDKQGHLVTLLPNELDVEYWVLFIIYRGV